MAIVTSVSKGDPFPTDAATVNSILNAAAANERRGEGLGAIGGFGATINQRILVKVKNDSGGDLNTYAILGIADVFPDPTENLAEFKFGQVLLSGVEPTSSHRGRFVVLAEPIKNGGIGLATISGLTRVEISGHYLNLTTDFLAADVTTGTSATISCTFNGSARVVWEEHVTSDWALVILGGSRFPEIPDFAKDYAWGFISGTGYGWIEIDTFACPA